jgi:hypothetical protein
VFEGEGGINDHEYMCCPECIKTCPDYEVDQIVFDQIDKLSVQATPGKHARNVIFHFANGPDSCPD